MKQGPAGGHAKGSASCGNAWAEESVESQKQASHPFHEPLGNLAQKRRDFHIPTARATRSGKVENQKQVSHFPLALRDDDYGTKFTERASGLRPRRAALRAASGVIVVDKEK
jgi:hypothetical protein